MYFEELTKRIGGSQVNYHFNFSLKNKYLYVQTSKCACTYLKTSLSRIELAPEVFFSPHYRYTHLDNIYKDALGGSPHRPVNNSCFVKPYQLGIQAFDELIANPDFFKFAVLRNPYSRILSAYLDTVKGRRPPLRSVKSYIAQIKNVPTDQLHFSEITFLDFLRGLQSQVEQSGWQEVDQHYRQQSFHISDDIIPYSKLYRVEEFSSALEDLSIRFKSPLAEVSRGSHTTNAKDKINNYYAKQESRDIAESLYQKDLDRFDYSFPES